MGKRARWDPGRGVFRVLLRLYPAPHRRRYGGEMETFFQEERTEAKNRLAFWPRLIADHIEAAWIVRRRYVNGGRGTMGRIVDDLRSAVRSLRRAPAFTAFAVLTLSLGIGATTAVFGVLDRVLLRPLPYPASDRMILVGIQSRGDPESLGPLSATLAHRFQIAPGPAEAAVASSADGLILDNGGDPERVTVDRVTKGFFEFFGATPATGRLLGDRDYDPGAPRVVVLGHGVWVDRYGSDPSIVGSSLRLNDEPHTVVGVVGRDFVRPPEVTEAGDYWTALPVSAAGEQGTFFLAGIARLRPGATAGELDAYADEVIDELYPSGDGPNFLLGGTVRDYRDTVVGPVGTTLPRVMAAVVLLLVIACVNVAGLLLTRGARRSREMAVRAALGAGRRRMMAQLLGESALLALGGAVVGAVLAWGAVEAFRAFAPAGLPRLAEVAVDGRGFAFSVGLALATVALFGLLPALRSAGGRGRIAEGRMRHTTPGRREGRLRGALIAVETALAVVLAAGSSLLAYDLIELANEEPGFRTEGLAAVRLDLRARYEPPEWDAVWASLLDGARGLPGVTAAALATQAPYDGSAIASTFRPEGREDGDGDFIIQVVVAGDYARAVGTEVVEGRSLEPSDDGGPPVAMVNEAFVREYWPGESAVGRWIHEGRSERLDEPSMQVVGVVGDVRTRVGREVPPQVYVPLSSAPWSRMELLVRTDGGAAALAEPLRDLVRRVDPELAVWRLTTVESLAEGGLARPRFYTGLFGGFAATALLLALVGVYGTTAYATRTRTREIGIRMALGARAGTVVRRVVVRTAAVVGAGVVGGLLAAGLSSRILTDVLVHAEPGDLRPYAVTGLVVLLAGVLSAWIPAARAGAVDPASTLREEV
ncbi:MAG: ADOP family duplicated permease [Longimicrobiales bacterium]